MTNYLYTYAFTEKISIGGIFWKEKNISGVDV